MTVEHDPALVAKAAEAIYAGGDEAEWLTTVDGSPNSGSYEYARRVLDAVAGDLEARALEAAANEWDRSDPEHLAALSQMVEERYRPGGPSVPAIWLRDRADRLTGGAS